MFNGGCPWNTPLSLAIDYSQSKALPEFAVGSVVR